METTMKSTGPFDHHSMLEEFFEEELKDIYWAEKHLVNALSKMAAAATSRNYARSHC